MPKKFTPEEYKERFSQLYPDYELLSDYAGDKEYILVRCKLDGYTWKTKPNWLKHGARCQKCYDRRRGDTIRKGKEKFIEQSKQLNGENRYNYDKVEYVNNKTDVILTCPKHGDFRVRPDKHLSRGDGCPECAKIENGLKRRTPQDVFFARCAKIHNNKYDYTNSVYNGYDKPITIVCPEHGEFTQMAGGHLAGNGCPVCSESHLEKKTKGILKENNISFIWQKRFKWLGRLSLDFYLPDYNIAIECQGLQHYSPFYFNWSKNASLEKIIKRDCLKNKLCQENKVDLIYFAREKAIYEAASIYTENNTFTSFNSLINYILSKGRASTETIELNKQDLKEMMMLTIEKLLNE